MNIESEIRLLHKEIELKNKEIETLNKIVDRHNKTEEWRFKIRYCNNCRILVLPIEKRPNLTIKQKNKEDTCPNCGNMEMI